MALSNGAWTDLIEEFLSYTTNLFTPEIFRLWSGIALVAGALERRIWARVGDYQTFPNTYILLVAPPGTGKQTIDEVQRLWELTREPSGAKPAFQTGPDSVSKASLMDVLDESRRSFLPPEGPIETFHSLLVAAEEIGVILPGYDQEFIATLNRIYTNPDHYRERRRTSSVRKLEIEKPQLNILAGATPAYFVSTFPEEAWTTGLIRRIILIYASEAPYKDLFEASPQRSAQQEHLLQRLSALAGLWGQMQWRKDAAWRLQDWHAAGGGRGGPPVPTHSKLEYYCRSRSMHAIKLSIVSAISRTGQMIIELPDVERAISWLLEAEAFMPDIFRAMTGRSDRQVIEELHYFAMAEWARGKQQPVQTEKLRRFLISRVPHDKVESLLEVADRARIVVRMAGTDGWVPRPKNEHGVE